MKQEWIRYIEDNKALFTMSRNYTPDQLNMIFEIYNGITGENKAKTRCARCLTNVVKRVYQTYLNNYAK